MAIKSKSHSTLYLCQEVQAEIFSSGVASADSSPNSGNPNMSATKEQGEKPKFGPCPEFDWQILI